jgi:hypothetical protein
MVFASACLNFVKAILVNIFAGCERRQTIAAVKSLLTLCCTVPRD